MKNKILKSIILFNFIIFILSMCNIDYSKNYLINIIICAISFSVLSLFAYANGWFYGQNEDDN